MTTPPETPKSERSWLRYPAWASVVAGLKASLFARVVISIAVLLGVPLFLALVLRIHFAITIPLTALVCSMWLLFYVWPRNPQVRLNVSRYENAAILAAVLLGMPLLFRFVLRVPFATMFTLMAFACLMRFLLYAWPRNPQTGKRRLGALATFAWVYSCALFFATWYTQPHFGANLCPSKGFMWETDFVEEVRPTIHSKIIKSSVQQPGWLPDGVTIAQFVAVADQAVDLLKQCVAERGVNYCRYAGPDLNGAMMQGRTMDGPNAIAPEDKSKYRYIRTGVDYDISMIPEDSGGSEVIIKTSRFGKPIDTRGKICDLGCWCNENYGR